MRMMLWLFVGCVGFGARTGLGADSFRVGAYNVEMYIDQGFGGDRPKSAEAKAKVQESILALKADVLALEEMGGTNLLMELREELARKGLVYPHWEFVQAHDTNLHLALLSRFPFVERRSHTKEAYLLGGRRFFVNRGFLEVEVQVNSSYRFTLLSAHLKSKRQSAYADEEELREQEAVLLREKVESLLAAEPGRNIVVLGDFNDYKSSRTLRMLIGRGASALIDTRPTERGADFSKAEGQRQIAWTHYFARDETYSRIDYILLSRGMAREWLREDTLVLARPDWGEASDHRPIVAGFEARDR